MEEEVVVDADVDEEEELRKVFKFLNLLWLQGLILGETLEAARKIKASQGYQEHEVSYGGEADLLRHYTRCQKNPGHSQFIQVHDFKIEHLPLSHRDILIFDYIRAEADLTCRLLMRYTSENRPTYHPVRKHLLYPFSQVRGRNFIRVGTGRVDNMYKYTEKDNKYCECEECERPGTHKHKVWGKIIIGSARHVVFDDDEAKRTSCYFGYDTNTTLLHCCLKLTGLIFEKEGLSVGDWCAMTYVTHDMAVFDKLYKMWCHRAKLILKLWRKYPPDQNSYLKDPKPEHVVIISHPHGFSKQISVGMWTQRQTWGEKYKRKMIWGGDSVCMDTSYTYNTPTCPGSSGAPIIRLLEKGKWWGLGARAHSEGSKKNNNENSSAVMGEVFSLPSHFQNQ